MRLCRDFPVSLVYNRHIYKRKHRTTLTSKAHFVLLFHVTWATALEDKTRRRRIEPLRNSRDDVDYSPEKMITLRCINNKNHLIKESLRILFNCTSSKRSLCFDEKRNRDFHQDVFRMFEISNFYSEKRLYTSVWMLPLNKQKAINGAVKFFICYHLPI